MQKKGFTLVELIAVIVVLGIIIMLAVSTFKNVGDRVKKEAYENKVNLIKTKASEYANGTKVLVTNVDHLVKKGYLSADNEDGDVINPIDGSRMNCKIITMYKSEGNYYANYVEDETKEECDASKIKYDNGYTSIEKYLYINGTKRELLEGDEWVRENNLLELKVNDEEMIPISDIEMVKWETNTGTEEKRGEDKFSYVIDNSIVDTTISAIVYLKPNGNGETNDRTFTAVTWVKIDKKRPWVDQKVEIDRPNEWTNYGKEVRITAGDEGSGVKAYAVVEEQEWNELTGTNKCENAQYDEKEGNAYTTRLDNGKYYVCVKDRAGNVSEDMKEPLFEIDKSDATPPKCEIRLPQPNGNEGWYTEDILFEFIDGAEEEEKFGSGIDQKQIFIDGREETVGSYTLNYDTPKFKVSMNVTDKAGNICHQEVEVKRDATQPSCSYTGESTVWTKGNRTVSLACQDNLSGCIKTDIASHTYTTTASTASFGDYTITDHAGNSNTCNRSVNVYVDKCDSSRASYGNWSSCSKSCGGGTESRSITYISTTGSGFTCPENGRPTIESTSCNTSPCPDTDGGDSGSDGGGSDCDHHAGNCGPCSGGCSYPDGWEPSHNAWCEDCCC